MKLSVTDELDNLTLRRQLKWQKAKASNPGNCVEFAKLSDGSVALRDSKDPDGPVMHYTVQEVAAFLDGAKKGEFDNLI